MPPRRIHPEPGPEKWDIHLPQPDAWADTRPAKDDITIQCIGTIKKCGRKYGVLELRKATAKE